MAGMLGLMMGQVREDETANQGLAAELGCYEHLTAELQSAPAKEQELNRRTGRLIAQLSHDFKTSLSNIRASAELLRLYADKFSPEKKNEIHARI